MSTPEKLRKAFKGVIALTVTPFKKDKTIDEEKLRENVDYLIRNEANVLVVNGSCGECYAMTLEEQKKVIKIAVDEVNGRIPVVAGTSHSGTDIAIELSKYAEDVGADGVQVIPPYYYVADVIAHYKRISEAINIGIVIYNNPEVVHKALTPETLLKMISEARNIIGIKDCTEDLVMASETIKALGNKVAVTCGTGEALAPFFYLLGSPGAYSSIVNFAPQFPVKMYKAAIRGDYKEMMDIHQRLIPLMKFIREHGPFIRVIKGAMELMGRSAGPVRLPLTPLTPEEKEELKTILVELGLLENI